MEKPRSRVMGWRKWTVVMTTLGLSFYLALTGKLSGEWVNICMFVVGAFVSGNTAERFFEGRKPDPGVP